MHECPVVTTFTCLVGSPTLDKAMVPSGSDAEFARSVNALHQVRLLLVRDGAIGITYQDRVGGRSPRKAVQELLGAYARWTNSALLTTLVATRIAVCRYDDACFDNHGVATARAGHEHGYCRPGHLIMNS